MTAIPAEAIPAEDGPAEASPAEDGLLAGDFLDPEEGLDREQIEKLQEQRLLEILPYAYERSALTRSVWQRADVHPREVRTLNDFRSIAPFIDQDELRAYRLSTGDPFAGTLCLGPGELGYLGTTSGTTGNPTPIAHTVMGPTERARGRELWMLGARAGDTVTVLMFSFRSGIDLLCERAPSMGITRLFLRHASEEVPRLFEATAEHSPVLLYLLSTPMIIAIDEYANRNGIDVREAFSGYRAAVYGGEPLSAWARGRLEAWGIAVAQMTAAGDVMPATECLARAGSHVWEDLVLAEHLLPDERTVAGPGERGELVITSLTDTASPLIRFRTDDMVLMDPSRCGCGRSHARIRTLGRTGDLLNVNGRSVLPSEVGPALDGIEPCRAGLFQVVRGSAEAGALKVRVGYDADLAGDLMELRGEVVAALGDRLGVVVDVDLVSNAELLVQGPPHKIPRMVDS